MIFQEGRSQVAEPSSAGGSRASGVTPPLNQSHGNPGLPLINVHPPLGDVLPNAAQGMRYGARLSELQERTRDLIKELRSGCRSSGYARARPDLLVSLFNFQGLAESLIEELMRQRRIGSEARARREVKRLQKARKRTRRR